MFVFCENKCNLKNKCFFFENKKYVKLRKSILSHFAVAFLSATRQFLAVSINPGSSTLTYLYVNTCSQ